MVDARDPRNTRWETLFDQAVTLAAARRLSDTLSMLKRIRSWQHRQTRYGSENHNWHDAELLWLQGVVLERARQPTKAGLVWLRLARIYKVLARHSESDFFLSVCTRCAERVIGFAPSWLSVATQLRDRAADVSATAASFRQLALGSTDGGMLRAVPRTSSAEAEFFAKGAGTAKHAATSPNRSKLLAKREAIRRTYRDLEQPATVVELCEQYLNIELTDGVVWAWYGHSLSELGRYDESAAALQTARGLVTTADTRAFVFQCQGDLEYEQGRYAQAAAFYREAVAEGVGDWALIMLGRALFRLAATDEAEQCFRQAVAMKGSHPATALYELGRILRSRSALFESRRVLRQALTLESHGDIRECLADVERAIRLQSPAGGVPKLVAPKTD